MAQTQLHGIRTGMLVAESCSVQQSRPKSVKIKMTRLLVLGGSSYVAQFIFERYFKQRQEVGDASTAEYVVACTLRASSSSESTLPVGFTSSPPDPDSGEQLVHVYWNVDLLSMTGVRECIRHFRPDVIVNCIGMHSPVYLVDLAV